MTDIQSDLKTKTNATDKPSVTVEQIANNVVNLIKNTETKIEEKIDKLENLKDKVEDKLENLKDKI
jgi:flagellar biosynthesis chaperone FliJ